MTETWDKLKPEIERICMRRGIPKVAAEIPASRATVYRLLNGDTSRPSRAVQAGIERVVQAEEQKQP